LRERSYSLLRRRNIRVLRKIFPQFSDHVTYVKEILNDVLVPNLNLRLWQDFTRYSIPGLLHFEDRNSMAFGIESRVPFLDYRLVDYIMAIPGIYKIYNGWSKWIFRMAMKDILPPKILWRKSKLGFSTPERKWLSEGNNPFKSFMNHYEMTYDGDFFWWRLFLTSYWMKLKGMT
jgi:asparagine synthetase B (glutamine-hydrolysing)